MSREQKGLWIKSAVAEEINDQFMIENFCANGKVGYNICLHELGAKHGTSIPCMQPLLDVKTCLGPRSVLVKQSSSVRKELLPRIS